MKHSFHVFHRGLKTFKRNKGLGLRLDVHPVFTFSYHDETLELVFHMLLIVPIAFGLHPHHLSGHEAGFLTQCGRDLPGVDQ